MATIYTNDADGGDGGRDSKSTSGSKLDQAFQLLHDGKKLKSENKNWDAADRFVQEKAAAVATVRIAGLPPPSSHLGSTHISVVYVSSQNQTFVKGALYQPKRAI